MASPNQLAQSLCVRWQHSGAREAVNEASPLWMKVGSAAVLLGVHLAVAQQPSGEPLIMGGGAMAWSAGQAYLATTDRV